MSLIHPFIFTPAFFRGRTAGATILGGKENFTVFSSRISKRCGECGQRGTAHCAWAILPFIEHVMLKWSRDKYSRERDALAVVVMVKPALHAMLTRSQ